MNKRLHYILCTLLTVMMLSAAAPAQAQVKGETMFGVKTGYVTRNESALAGLTFGYSFSRHFRVMPEIGIIFRHENLDGLDIACNAQFPVSFAQGKAVFYPLTGINFTSWGLHNEATGHSEDDDVTTHRNCMGLNFGAGIEYRCTSSMALHLDARYTLMRHYPTAFVTAGLAYLF